jgi:GT2 family glycosyltransferase
LTSTRTSIVIPTYRRPRLLARAIRSALAQTHADLEVWVYDNDSGDETAEVVAGMAGADGRLHYHRQPENLGSFGNFRHAIEHVRTPFFSVLSDDDVVLPDFHRLALESFAARPELAFVALDCLQSELDGSLLRRRLIEPGAYAPPAGPVEMLRQGHPTWTSVLFRGELLELIGPLEPKTDLFLDLDVLLRAAAVAPFEVRPEAGAVFFIHDAASSSSTTQDNRRWEAYRAVIDRMAADPNLPDPERGEVERLLREGLRATLIQAGLGAARRGNGAAAEVAARHLALAGAAGWALLVRLLATAGRLGAARSLLAAAARARRPYTGERLATVLARLPEARDSAGWLLTVS